MKLEEIKLEKNKKPSKNWLDRTEVRGIAASGLNVCDIWGSHEQSDLVLKPFHNGNELGN